MSNKCLTPFQQLRSYSWRENYIREGSGQVFKCCLPNTAVIGSMVDRNYEMNDQIYGVREKTATGARLLLFSKDSKFSFICLVLYTWTSTIVDRARQTTAFDISDVVH